MSGLCCSCSKDTLCKLPPSILCIHSEISIAPKKPEWVARWWFQIFLFSLLFWGSFPIQLIFFSKGKASPNIKKTTRWGLEDNFWTMLSTGVQPRFQRYGMKWCVWSSTYPTWHNSHVFLGAKKKLPGREKQNVTKTQRGPYFLCHTWSYNLFKLPYKCL